MNQDFRLSREQRLGLIDQMIAALRSSQTATDIMDEAFCDFLGINRTDGRCLDVLDRLGEVTAGQLAKEMDLTTGAVTAMVDRLEATGLVRRTSDPGDRRKVLIQMTPDARQITVEVYGQMANATAPYIEQLSDRDLLTLIAFFEASRRINLEIAAKVRTRVDRRKVPLRQRVEQAKVLRDDAKSLLKTMKREVKDWVKVDFLIGDTRWVQDESGRWVEEKRP